MLLRMMQKYASDKRLILAAVLSLTFHGAVLASLNSPRLRPGTPHAETILNASLLPVPPVPVPPTPEVTPPTIKTATPSIASSTPPKLQPAPPTPPIGAGGLDTAPLPLVDIEPDYPENAYALKLSGQVEVEVWIDETGRVEDAHVVAATIDDIFNQSALKAVRETRFTPGMAGGLPVKSAIRAVIVFEYK